MAAFDYNGWYRNAGSGCYVLIKWQDGDPVAPTYYATAADLTAAKGWGAHDQDLTTGGDPFFVDVAHGDYTVRSSSVAYHAGTAIPADVMEVLGLSTGTGLSRGALWWPGAP